VLSLHRALIALLVVACSAKAPTTRDSSRGAPPPDRPMITSPAAEKLPPPDPREVALSQVVVQLLEQEHLLRKKLDDTVSRAAFDSYVDRIDGGKMFLLRADRDALWKYADQIDDQLRSGSLTLAHDGSKVFVTRVTFVEEAVAKILAAPLDLTDVEYFELDPKKTSLAETEDELRDRWRRRLELEVLERVGAMEARLAPAKPGAPEDHDEADEPSTPITQIPATPELREAKAREDLAKTYAARFVRLRTPGPLDAAADLVNAVTTTLDPHSTYLPPAEKANFDIQMSGSVEGIGAVLREKEHLIEILELVPGGASWRQGDLEAGDLVLSVAADGKEPVDVFDMRIEEVVKMIRGPKGTVVHLRVQKASGQQETISITRDVVVIEAAYARGAVVTPKGKATYGYINLPSFYGGRGDNQRTAAGDVHALLAEMKQKKVAGVVLDLRGNGGGILGDSIELSGELIDSGPIVQVQDSKGKREVFKDKIAGFEYDGPVVVLVDRFSASASEIVAGALQDYKRAVIVGTGPTHGKGTVQTLADLDQATGGKIELGVLKLTVQQFFRPSGASTQLQGVVPDILLPDPAGYLETGERKLEHAIEWSQIDPAKHADWPATWKVEDLGKRSVARVSKDPVFAKLATMTELLRVRQNDTRVPLQKTAWEQRRKEQRAALEAASPDLAKTPARLTVRSIGEKEIVPPANGKANGKPNGKAVDRVAKWRDSLARDPWVDESVQILHDMAGK
jgi:carboxyl-terminal processing protease